MNVLYFELNMKVEICQPVGFTEVGQRDNNEDSIFPPLGLVSDETRLFLVCDGVGGQHRGEVASELACASFARYFSIHPVAVMDESYLRNALKYTIEAFNEAEAQDSETSGMATTLTLLHLNEAGATVAHLGDSRVYQIRDGRVIRATSDHKLVNDLVREGHLTEAEAANHPQRNVISKVVAADRLDEPEVTVINDLLPGDYFFLCTDGVLEQLYDDLLGYHLGQQAGNDLTDAQRLENIRQECAGRTRDNFSAYLIRVKSVTGDIPPEHLVILPPIEALPELPVALPSQGRTVYPPDYESIYEHDAPTQFVRPVVQEISKPSARPTPATTTPNAPKWLIPLAVVLVVLAAGGWYWLRPGTTPVGKVANTPPPVPAVEPAAPIAENLPIISEAANSANATAPSAPPTVAAQADSEENYEVIAASERYDFKIIRRGKRYYTLEKSPKKQTPIQFDENLSEPGLYYFYKFLNSEEYCLYLERPDQRIHHIAASGISTEPPRKVTYVGQQGEKHVIDPLTGKEIGPSVKVLQDGQSAADDTHRPN